MKAEAAAAPPSYVWDNTKCLKQYDITLIVDDSGSMGPQDHDGPGTASLWTLAKTAVGDLVTAVVEHNPQGLQTAAEVGKLFNAIEPAGLTPIGKRLRKILPYQHWWSSGPAKKKLYLVVTDGQPSDEEVLKKAITRAATGYSKDRKATRLTVQCVEIIVSGRLDIVDTTTTSPEDGHLGKHLIKALVGAVIGYVDREEIVG
ncbi:hypothetical protein B0H14DRAFT_2964570 [Mycena olivaceomarginata]|nr:hypothetical protein B0H14DRAFT_2964570 [Mycena olivaceomarginata]